MGIEVPDNEHFRNGKRLHRIIQDHVGGIKEHENLKHINYKFKYVERVDFDPKCRIWYKVNDKYGIHGYVDGFDPDTKKILEIKTGSTMWGIKKFIDSPQRKIYGLAKPSYEETVLITTVNDSEWKNIPPKTMTVPITEKDKEEAIEWIMEGIEIIEKGEFTGGLDEDGKCRDRFCYYGVNCQFKDR